MNEVPEVIQNDGSVSPLGVTSTTVLASSVTGLPPASTLAADQQHLVAAMPDDGVQPPPVAEKLPTPQIQQALTIAVKHHQGGRPQEAEAIYRQVLQHDPQQPDALHLLGLLAYENGRHRQAIDYLNRAIRVKPDEAAFHCDLGIVHRALGELDQAVSAHQRALELDPDFTNAHYNLGNVRGQQGRPEAAAAAFRRALAINPAHSQAANNLGKLLHEQGDIEEATELFRQAVEAAPNSAEAHYNLGRMLLAEGKLDEAVAALRRSAAGGAAYFEVQIDLARALHRQKEFTPAAEALERAARLAPDSAEAHNSLGSVFFESGDVEKSMAHYQRSLKLEPDCAEAHHGLGIALRSREKLREAADHFRSAVEAKPRMGAYNNLGLTYHEMGKLDEAIAAYRQAEEMGPTDANLENNFGNTLYAQERIEDAVVHYRRALEVKPDHVAALNNLGNALKRQGQVDEAIACLGRALEIDPDHAHALNNLGNAYLAQQQVAKATACYRQALEKNPGLFEAHNNLGTILYQRKRVVEAFACYRRALEIKPDHADTLNNFAEALKDGGQTEEAAAMIQKAQEIKPSNKRRFSLATVLPAIGRSVDELARWRRRMVDQLSGMIEEGIQLDPTRDAAPVLFYLAYQGMNDRPIQEMVTRLYAKETDSLKPRPPTDPNRSGKIRVGFISKYLRNHTIGKLSQGLIAQLSRRTFDVTVFSLEANDEPMAREIQHQADRYVVVPGNVSKARQIVSDAQVDVLFYTDVGMDPMTSALARARLAPVQCVTWGHPVTTGIPQIDYFISSNLLEPPGAEEHYTERLVRLDTLPVYFHRPRLSSPPKRRTDFGLSDSSHIYLCPQSLFKFHPDFDRPLAQILRRDSLGEVVLIEGAFPHWKKLLMDRFRATIPDVVDRIRFVPSQKLEDFLHLVALSDVVLDPLHFGGGSSTYETLALGTPIVTRPSEFMRGRVTYACYQKMGLLDCVAWDIDDYVNLAVRLGTDRAYRDRIRGKILAAADVLFEDQEAVRQIEQFFVWVVKDQKDAGHQPNDRQGPHLDLAKRPLHESVGHGRRFRPE